MTVRPWNFPERLRFATGRKNDVPCSLERNLKSLQGVSVILDDEYAQGIEIRSVSSHTVWGIGSRDPACRDKLTRAVENESCSLCNFLALGTQRAALASNGRVRKSPDQDPVLQT